MSLAFFSFILALRFLGSENRYGELRKKGLHSRGRKLDDGGSRWRLSTLGFAFCCFVDRCESLEKYCEPQKKGFPSSNDELREDGSSILYFRGFSIPFSFPIDFNTCRHSPDFFTLCVIFSTLGWKKPWALIRTLKVFVESWEIHQHEECCSQTPSDEIY